MPPATAGWEQQAGAGKPQLQIPFSELSPDSFFFLSLPTLDEKTTKLYLHAEKLTETILHLNLGHFVGGFLCAVLFYFMRPLWWENYRTTSEAPSPGLETETDTKIIKTETSLHLNLEVCFFLISIFHFFLFIYIFPSFTYFLFLFLFLFFLFFIFNPLSVSLMPV
jgi:hypothetical protein